MSNIVIVPLSQGKPIEWKLKNIDWLAELEGFPSRRGNQLNGNFASRMDTFPHIVRVPLSQGKPIEWKLP